MAYFLGGRVLLPVNAVLESWHCEQLLGYLFLCCGTAAQAANKKALEVVVRCNNALSSLS